MGLVQNCAALFVANKTKQRYPTWRVQLGGDIRLSA